MNATGPCERQTHDLDRSATFKTPKPESDEVATNAGVTNARSDLSVEHRRTELCGLEHTEEVLEVLQEHLGGILLTDRWDRLRE